MTNLEHLLNSIKRAELDKIQVYKNCGVNNEDYTVISDKKAYQIKVRDEVIVACDCPHCTYRKVICKHMIRVSLDYNLNIANLSMRNED